MYKTPPQQFELVVRRPGPGDLFADWRQQQEDTLLAIPRSVHWQQKSYPLFEISALQYSSTDPSDVKVFLLFDLLIADATSLSIIQGWQ